MPERTYEPSFVEICTKVNNAKDKPAKIKVLREYRSQSLEMFLKGALDPNMEWLLPEGQVPYMPNEAPEGTEHTMLISEARKLYHYIKGANNLTGHKREQMFVQLLEGLHAGEADVLCSAKDKKLHQKYKGLSANVVKEAFNWNDDYKLDDQHVYHQAEGPANG